MGLGSTISRGLSVASSSTYEPSHRSGPASTKSGVRASTVTSATSVSKLIRSASTSRESMAPSVSSTVRPPTYTSRTSKPSSTARASTITSATSTSNLIRSASTASTLFSQKATPAGSTTSLLSSATKRAAPSYFSTAASRLLWGRPPPGHSTLQPSQIASLTHTLSLPAETPMLSSVVGALDLPLSRSQYSYVRSSFCDAHFWFEQKYIDELTEVVAHEIGPQLDKLRTAPKELISKKTERLLSTLEPYRDIFAASASASDTSSILSLKPPCPACTLSLFFQNPTAVRALSTSAKGRKHRNQPWPASLAWLEPCPGGGHKGVDWEAQWKADGRSIGHDRVRVQRWRRDNRLPEHVPEEGAQALGHQPGEGCDFCDALRLERADEAELDAVIAEEGGEGEEGSYDGEDTLCDGDSATIRRAMTEESIIGDYMRSSTTLGSVYADEEEEGRADRGRQGDEDDEALTIEQAKRASDWARTYQVLVGKSPGAQSRVQLERYPGLDVRGQEMGV